MLLNRKELLKTNSTLKNIIHDPGIDDEDQARVAVKLAIEASSAAALAMKFRKAFDVSYFRHPTASMASAFDAVLNMIEDATPVDTGMRDAIAYLCAAETFVLVDNAPLEPSIADILNITYDEENENEDGSPNPRMIPPWMRTYQQRHGR